MEAMNREREAIHAKYKTEIDILSTQLNRMKNAQSQSNPGPTKEEEELKEQIQNYRASAEEMKQIVEMKTQRVEELEDNSRKLIDENITLTAGSESLKAEVEKKAKECQHLQLRIE